jgi:hypothetical protein
MFHELTRIMCSAALARQRSFGDTCRAFPTKSVNYYSCYVEEVKMKNPLDSLWGTVISGLVLTVVLYVFANNFLIAG